MRLIRQVWRALALVALVFLGLGILALKFPSWTDQQRMNMISRWSGWLLSALNVQVQVQVQPGAQSLNQFEGAALVAANHVSWLDIFAINSVAGCHFVAKSDIRGWPLLGKLCADSGTIFVERAKRHAVKDVLHQMANIMSAGGRTAVFPEGTTSDMKVLKPFHANLLQAAVSVKAPIIPVALSYFDDQQNISQAALFVGDTTFADSFLTIAGQSITTVRVVICPALPVTEQTTRHQLAEQACQSISNVLGFQPGA
jgi:1-acyl-sn-glycerol-3-phosphate acyltransferase